MLINHPRPPPFSLLHPNLNGSSKRGGELVIFAPMQRLLFPFIILLFVTSCVQGTETTSDGAGRRVKQLHWYDSLVLDYIEHNENTALRQAQSDSLQIEWKFDGMIQTDSIEFMAFRVGHTTDRFITDDWVYIDSINRLVYGHDAGTDSISPWHHE